MKKTGLSNPQIWGKGGKALKPKATQKPTTKIGNLQAREKSMGVLANGNNQTTVKVIRDYNFSWTDLNTGRRKKKG